jgi:hypothetical protein
VAFNSPRGLDLNASGFIAVADASNNRIRLIAPGGAVTTTLSGSGALAHADGPPATAAYAAPEGVAFFTLADGSPALAVADTFNHALRAVFLGNGSAVTLVGGGGGLGGGGGGGGGWAPALPPHLPHRGCLAQQRPCGWPQLPCAAVPALWARCG